MSSCFEDTFLKKNRDVLGESSNWYFFCTVQTKKNFLRLKNFVVKCFKSKFSKVNKQQKLFPRKVRTRIVSKKKKKSPFFTFSTLFQMDDLKFKAQTLLARFSRFFSSYHSRNYSCLKKTKNSKFGKKLNFA